MDLKERLVDFLNQSGLKVTDENVQVQQAGSSCFALVACQNVNGAIATLQNAVFDGRTLVVQRERKNRQNGSATKNKQPFGGGWSKPKQAKEDKPAVTLAYKKPTLDSTNKKQNAIEGGVDEWYVSEHVANVVASEIKAAEEDPSRGDALNTVIASTAAMSLLGSMNAFGLDNQPVSSVTTTDAPLLLTNPALDDEPVDNEPPDDFRSLSKKPLSELLADYGEQDLDFNKVVPTEESCNEESASKKSRDDYQNRLTLQGKAPIHVELTSFGYVHGAPSELRSGWSHAHPLPPVDCRHLPQVPHYMARQDGLSPAVKRALLNARKEDDTRDNSVRQCANQMGKDIFEALGEAIASGGYGHASPLRMAVYVGSESGRHRSVLVCELAATALRKLLRSNVDNRITQPVSVGTRHRDIERRQRDVERKKQKDLESDW